MDAKGHPQGPVQSLRICARNELRTFRNRFTLSDVATFGALLLFADVMSVCM
jgi:hypothetical protein